MVSHGIEVWYMQASKQESLASCVVLLVQFSSASLSILVVSRCKSRAAQISRVLNVESKDLEAVKKKFGSSKFGSVASMKINVLPEEL